METRVLCVQLPNWVVCWWNIVSCWCSVQRLVWRTLLATTSKMRPQEALSFIIPTDGCDEMPHDIISLGLYQIGKRVSYFRVLNFLALCSTTNITWAAAATFLLPSFAYNLVSDVVHELKARSSRNGCWDCSETIVLMTVRRVFQSHGIRSLSSQSGRISERSIGL